MFTLAPLNLANLEHLLAIYFENVAVTIGVANGMKFETHRDAETDILKSETETEKFSDLIEKHIYD